MSKANEVEDYTKYILFNIEDGKQFESFDRDQPILSPEPPKAGEFLNQSGCYFEVLTLLQHFDAGYVEVYARSLGDSENFLKYIQEKFLVK
ncbi:hypothetical protein KO528_17360 [Saccharophagus degradans]|uniref:hypothetical protein n=1 Tax=Saccharophagus degradans TaxID=86304 RepID=UPI001C098B0B|nr:hypothetical protein [Saccharophagus degradans]MBU2987138.1 hypothetical protein [Saccharophagus degradans]